MNNKNEVLTITWKENGISTNSYIYRVTGNEAALELYRERQGAYLVEDDETGDPLYFLPRTQEFRASGSLIAFSAKSNRYWPYDTEETLLAQAAETRAAANRMRIRSITVTPPTATAPEKPAELQGPEPVKPTASGKRNRMN